MDKMPVLARRMGPEHETMRIECFRAFSAVPPEGQVSSHIHGSDRRDGKLPVVVVAHVSEPCIEVQLPAASHRPRAREISPGKAGGSARQQPLHRLRLQAMIST